MVTGSSAVYSDAAESVVHLLAVGFAAWALRLAHKPADETHHFGHDKVAFLSAGFEGAAWVRWGSFAVYGVKLHLLCSTNRIPISYELTAGLNVADALLVRELVAGAGLVEGDLARRLLGDLAYRGGGLAAELARSGILLATEKADRRPPIRQQVEVCFAALKRVVGMDGTLAKTLVGLATRIAATGTRVTR